MYNFWFDADSPSAGSHTLTLFKPGSPTAIVFTFGNIFAVGFESNGTTAWSVTLP